MFAKARIQPTNSQFRNWTDFSVRARGSDRSRAQSNSFRWLSSGNVGTLEGHGSWIAQGRQGRRIGFSNGEPNGWRFWSEELRQSDFGRFGGNFENRGQRMAGGSLQSARSGRRLERLAGSRPCDRRGDLFRWTGGSWPFRAKNYILEPFGKNIGSHSELLEPLQPRFKGRCGDSHRRRPRSDCGNSRGTGRRPSHVGSYRPESRAQTRAELVTEPDRR